ncbi:hypothetical protein K438DRAFT_1887161 [Mycena galopus ATCC 62051]|nr:hypothetical protein K438DRAFT_1887161 [Mycena galopus ATCC 62051]
MTKAWAKEKKRRRKEEEARRFEEERERRAPVSTPSPLSFPAAPTFAPSSLYHNDLAGVYGLHPAHPMHNTSGLLSIDDDEPIPANSPRFRCDDIPDEQPVDAVHASSHRWSDAVPKLATIHTVDVAPPVPAPRDFSALCSGSAHPWRTIRRRNHRLLPQRREQRPFPWPLPKRVPASLTAIHTVAVDPTPTPPTPPPLVVDIPPPPVVLAPTLPAETAYGPVHTKLALACAHELPNRVITLEQVFDIVWGPYADNNQKNLLVQLTADQLVLLCTLAAIAAVEPVFAGFLHPVIMNFADTWVAHCRGDSFG